MRRKGAARPSAVSDVTSRTSTRARVIGCYLVTRMSGRQLGPGRPALIFGAIAHDYDGALKCFLDRAFATDQLMVGSQLSGNAGNLRFSWYPGGSCGPAQGRGH